jgi:hypothetical protein
MIESFIGCEIAMNALHWLKVTRVVIASWGSWKAVVPTPDLAGHRAHFNPIQVKANWN